MNIIGINNNKIQFNIASNNTEILKDNYEMVGVGLDELYVSINLKSREDIENLTKFLLLCQPCLNNIVDKNE